MFGTILGYIGAILVIAFMIMAHELGHFTAGRALGFAIDKFAIGFGPKLISWNKRETEFSIRLLPLGGFCLFHGEDENSSDPHAFNNQKAWKRLIVIVAGAVANLITAVLVSIVILSVYGDAQPVVQEVTPASPAAEYGIMEGDVIRSYQGQDIDFAIEMSLALSKSDDAVNLDMTVERDGELINLEIPRQYDEAEERYLAGFSFTQEAVDYSLGESITLSFKWLYMITRQTYQFLGGLFTGQTSTKDMGGILMVTDTIQEAFHISFGMVLQMVALLSVNLAIVNMLPLPALDGGRAVFIAIEAIFRKPVKREIEGTIHAIGMLLLFALMFFLLYQDAIRKWF
ncbi:MAG: M50 family metallopeptidase [Eubacteriales bacterium]